MFVVNQHTHISARSLYRVRKQTLSRVAGGPNEAARINAGPSVGAVSAEVLAVCGRRCIGQEADAAAKVYLGKVIPT